MTVYINHTNPAKYNDLALTLVRLGKPQVIAHQLAREIIDNRYTVYANIQIVHLGA